MYPQIAGRPFGMLIGFQTNHAFAKRPTFASLAHLPFDELVAELKKPGSPVGHFGRGRPAS